jgi:hypothetical protein
MEDVKISVTDCSVGVPEVGIFFEKAERRSPELKRVEVLSRYEGMRNTEPEAQYR